MCKKILGHNKMKQNINQKMLQKEQNIELGLRKLDGDGLGRRKRKLMFENQHKKTKTHRYFMGDIIGSEW